LLSSSLTLKPVFAGGYLKTFGRKVSKKQKIVDKLDLVLLKLS